MLFSSSSHAALRVGLPVALFLLLLAPAGCTTPEKRIQRFRDAWGKGDYAVAEAEIDKLISDETGVALEEVEASSNLADLVDAEADNTCLYLLDKAMVRAARGDYPAAVKLLRVARDALDARNDGTTVADVGSLLVDDVLRPFRGADYEVILTRVMLAIFDLLIEAKDAYSYALQIGEKQEEIFGKPLGAAFAEAPDPRKQYQRVSIGAYMEGMIHESNFANSSAEKAYTRAREWADGGVPILDECITRVTEGDFAPEGSGVLHVFYLAGRGPRLVQSRSPVTDTALLIAKIIAVAGGHGEVLIGQAPVPVPGLMIDDGRVAPLYITLPDGSQATTQILLDTHQVAKQQIDANMPWIIARAVVRRALKAVASKQVENQVGKSQGATTGRVLGMLTNLALTAGERADTRQWVALPSQIQVARVTVPEGEHALDFGQGMVARLRMFAGRESYVVVIRPNLAIPGTVLVDEFSLPQEQSAEAVKTAPQP